MLISLQEDDAEITRALKQDSEALRYAEWWVRRRIYGLSDEEMRWLAEQYLAARKELINLISGAMGDTGINPLQRERLLQQVEQEILALYQTIEPGMVDGLVRAYLQGAAGRRWVLEQATITDFRARAPLLPAGAIRALLLQPYLGVQFGETLSWSRVQFVNEIKRSLTQSMILGEGMRKAAARLDRSLGIKPGQRSGFGGDFWRTMLIARTEIMRASNLGALAVYEANADVLNGWEWVATRDERTCPICGGLDGKVFKFGDMQSIPPSGSHLGCILPGNEIELPGQLIAATKSYFVGPAVEILFRDGRRIAVTANHPILTRAGWKRAENITTADYVVRAIDSQGIVLSVNPDNDNRPMVIEDIFETLMKTSSMSTATMPATAEQFYGDGCFINGDVNVVFPDGLLLSDRQSALNEPICKHILGDSDARLISFAPDGATLKKFIGRGKVTHAFMGGAEHIVPFFVGGVGPSNVHTFGNIARLNTVFDQTAAQDGTRDAEFDSERLFTLTGEITSDNSIEMGNVNPVAPHGDVIFFENAHDNLSINTEFAREFVSRFAGKIALDEVVSIRNFNFAGHVYDLQVEPYELYICNGVVVKNCRCTIVPVLIDTALQTEIAGVRETYDEWAARVGVGDDGGLGTQRGTSQAKTGQL